MLTKTGQTAHLRTSRLGMFLIFVLMIVVSGCLGFALASGLTDLFVSKTKPELKIGPDAYAWDGTPPRLPIIVPDPGRRERWAVQVYRSKAGNPCLRVGRLHRNGHGTNDFGRVDPDGTFHRLDIEDDGSPTSLSETPYTLMFSHYALTGMAAMFGIVTSKVKTVTLHTASEIKEVPIAGGAYLAVQQEDDLRGARVHFAFRDGTGQTVKLRWHPPSAIHPRGSSS